MWSFGEICFLTDLLTKFFFPLCFDGIHIYTAILWRFFLRGYLLKFMIVHHNTSENFTTVLAQSISKIWNSFSWPISKILYIFLWLINKIHYLFPGLNKICNIYPSIVYWNSCFFVQSFGEICNSFLNFNEIMILFSKRLKIITICLRLLTKHPIFFHNHLKKLSVFFLL